MSTPFFSRMSQFPIALLFVYLVSLTVTAQTRPGTLSLPMTEVRSGTGEKTAQRIAALKDSNKNVRAALAAFEKKGLKMNITKSVAITGVIRRNEPAFQLAKFDPQQRTISGDGVEVLLISFVNNFNEWQGSTITTFTNPDGSVDEQYVADVVITRSEFDSTDWTCRFEVKFEDGIGYLKHQPGMFTGFHLGTPIQQQQAAFGERPPLDFLESQFTSSEARELYYQRFPEQRTYDEMAYPDGGRRRPPTQPAIYIVPQRDPDLPFRPPANGNTGTVTGWRPAAHEAGMICGAGAGGCAVASAIFAEASWAPCFVSTCAGGVLYAAAAHLRIRRN